MKKKGICVDGDEFEFELKEQIWSTLWWNLNFSLQCFCHISAYIFHFGCEWDEESIGVRDLKSKIVNLILDSML